MLSPCYLELPDRFVQGWNIISLMEYTMKRVIHGESSPSILPFGKVPREKAGSKGAVGVVSHVVGAKKWEYLSLHTSCDDVVLPLIYQGTHVLPDRGRFEKSLQLIRLESDNT